MAGKDDRSEGFLKKVLSAGQAKGYSHREIASLFAEVAAAAAPYAAAIATIADSALDGNAAAAKAGFVSNKHVSEVMGEVKPRFQASGTYLGGDGLLNDKFFEAVRLSSKGAAWT
jgi:hypothetical protein